jgi:5'-3' exonuclease
MDNKKLFLLDGMALIYRAHFALSKNPRFTSSGVNTSAVMGFANTLMEVLKKEKPSHIAVVLIRKHQLKDIQILWRIKHIVKQCPKIYLKHYPTFLN